MNGLRKVRVSDLMVLAPANYINLVQMDLEERGEHVYAKSSISRVAQGVSENLTIKESLLNVIREEQKKKKRVLQRISKLTA